MTALKMEIHSPCCFQTLLFLCRFPEIKLFQQTLWCTCKEVCCPLLCKTTKTEDTFFRVFIVTHMKHFSGAWSKSEGVTWLRWHWMKKLLSVELLMSLLTTVLSTLWKLSIFSFEGSGCVATRILKKWAVCTTCSMTGTTLLSKSLLSLPNLCVNCRWRQLRHWWYF